ncbi:MAG: hypothetical protein AMJ69_10940, partial [Gammaproteobacteria bacterium SG8_47]
SEWGCATLGEIIERCRDKVLSPYLVHKRPKQIRKTKQKDHWTQLSPQEISKGFAQAREASGLYRELAPNERPSFYELLSLGEFLRQKQGWSVPEIQQLKGHTSERMTRKYLEGHEWTTVQVPERG